MAKTSTATATYSEPTGIGTLEPGTRKAGIITLRIAALLSLVMLAAAVRPFNTAIQTAWAALHNWAGPLADSITHTRHAGPPIHVRASGSGWLAAGDRWPWTVAIAVSVLVVWSALAVNKMRRPDPVAEAAGRRNYLGIAAGVLVVLALVIVGAMQVDAGRAAVAGVLRGLAWLGGYAQHWTAELIGTKPTPLTHVTGG
jgi:hypothetical protein